MKKKKKQLPTCKESIEHSGKADQTQPYWHYHTLTAPVKAVSCLTMLGSCMLVTVRRTQKRDGWPKPTVLLLLGTKSPLLMFLIHFSRTSWSSARPGNLCKPYGLRHGHWSWSNGLCTSHCVCFQIWSFPLLLEQPLTAQILPNFLDIPRSTSCKESWGESWKCPLLIELTFKHAQLTIFPQISLTFWLHSTGRAAVISTAVRVTGLWALKGEQII